MLCKMFYDCFVYILFVCLCVCARDVMSKIVACCR